LGACCLIQTPRFKVTPDHFQLQAVYGGLVHKPSPIFL
jgi:hypothetical protein